MALTIKQIKEEWQTKSVEEQELWLKELATDNRKGVQQLIKQFERERQQKVELKKTYEKMSEFEKKLYEEGYKLIAGVDEVGRGPLAGPVVASSVILSKDCYIPKLNDSKKLSEKVREELYDVILEKAVAVGIGIVSAKEIDEMNIYQATKKAMKLAIEDLEYSPDYLLIDALELDLPIAQEGIIKGDARSVSIAASSIVAKVTRDRMMKEIAKTYPDYGFEQHMGYGTKQHIQAIEDYSICIEHRKSFSPIKEMIRKWEKR